MERTLSIIKPDAVRKNVVGKILTRFEDNGLKVVAMRMQQLSRAQVEEFYAIHRDKPFFGELLQYMTSGPVVVSVLEGNDAVALNRRLMGATDPMKADKGTIRADFAESINENAVHGSDSLDNAQSEIRFFFPEMMR